MRLRATTRRRDDDVAVIPLINVVFLILIFVMLTAILDPVSPLAVDLPGTAFESRAADAQTLTIDADGRLAYRGEVVAADALLDRLRAEGVERLTLRADAGLPLKMFRPLAEGLDRAGIEVAVMAVRR